MTQVIRVSGVLVHAPLQTVFDYLSDLTKHPEWSGGELKIEEASSGSVAVGKEYVSKGEIPMQKDRPNQLQVTEYEPPVKFGFTAQDANFGLVHHLFTFKRAGRRCASPTCSYDVLESIYGFRLSICHLSLHRQTNDGQSLHQTQNES